MLFEYPLAQTRFPLVEGEIPVAGLAQHRSIAGDGRARIYEIGGVERCAALFALVAVGVFVATVRASAGDVSVGEELSGLLVI